MAGQDEDSRSLVEALRAAKEEAWSGRINVSVDGHQVGAVVLRAGRVAWAVCTNQPEDLGTFLWRLGRLDKSDLDKVRARYESSHGKRKLGAMMEEAGVLPRSVLHRCVLLHTRRAMACLAEYPLARVRTMRTEFRVDEEMTFSLEDVLPNAAHSDRPPNPCTGAMLVGRWANWTDENQILAQLGDLPGYLGSGIFGREGEVVAAHAAGVVDPVTIGVFVVSVLESSLRTVRKAGLGDLGSLSFDCDEGIIITQWLNERRAHVAVVVVEPGGHKGMARYKVANLAPTFADWVGEGHKANSSVGNTPHSTDGTQPETECRVR